MESTDMVYVSDTAEISENQDNINNNNYSDVQSAPDMTANDITQEPPQTEVYLSKPHDPLTTPTDPFPEKLVISSEVTRDSLSQGAQQIIDDLNAKRKQDTQLLSNFKTALESQTENVYKSTEQHLFQVYEKQGKIVQDKLQLLFATIENIGKLEQELKEFKQALQILYQDMKD